MISPKNSKRLSAHISQAGSGKWIGFNDREEKIQKVSESRVVSLRPHSADVLLRDAKMETGICGDPLDLCASSEDWKSESRRIVRESYGNCQRPVGTTWRNDRARRRGVETNYRVQNSQGRRGRHRIPLITL